MTFVCANCGNDNPDGSLFCNRCGAKMGIASQPSESQRKCPQCTMWNEASRSVCKSCGADLTVKRGPPVPLTITRYCAWCGTGVGPNDKYCPVCRHDPSGTPPSRPKETVAIRQSQKPQIAGILMIGAGILELVSAVQVWSVDSSTLGLPVQASGLFSACGAIIFLTGLAATIGSYFAFRKLSFAIAISGSIAGILGLGVFYLGSIFSFIAMILIVMARDDFRR